MKDLLQASSFYMGNSPISVAIIVIPNAEDFISGEKISRGREKIFKSAIEEYVKINL